MTIVNIKAFIASLWDWSVLDGCFGSPEMRVTDIDGIIEVGGNYLMIETKFPGKEIPKGQRIMFDKLMENTENNHFTVLLAWGRPGLPVKLQLWPDEPYDANLEEMRRVVRNWYVFSRHNPI